MIYPKYRLAFPGKHVLMFEGKPLTQFNGYKLNTTAIGNGVVSADKSKGYFGESATLYVSAGPNYTYRGMSVNVGELSGMTYVFGRGDATLSAYFVDASTHYVVLEQVQGGTVTAIPMTGKYDDEITLSSTSNPHFNFNGYSITGATLTGDKFKFESSDVTAKGNWIEDPKFTAYFKQTSGGKLSGTPTTGYNGDVVTLVVNPSAHYSFVSANLTGATLTGNTFAFNGSDVSAEATWLQDPVYTATLVQNVGGTIQATPSTGYDGTVVTLSNTASAGYTFKNYSITGSTLTSNKFTFNGGNVTAEGSFKNEGDVKYNVCVEAPNYSAGWGQISHKPIHISVSGGKVVGLKMKWNIQPKQNITPQNVYGIRLNNYTWCSGYAWKTTNPQSNAVEPFQPDLWWGHYGVSGQELSAAGYKMPVVDARHDNIWHYLNPKLSGARTSVGGSYLFWNTATNCWGEHEFNYLWENYSDYTKENEPHVSAYLDGELQYTCWHPSQLMQVNEIQGFNYGAYPTSLFNGSVCPIQVCTFNSVKDANDWARG